MTPFHEETYLNFSPVRHEPPFFKASPGGLFKNNQLVKC